MFVMCTELPEKYPQQPVARCAAFRPATDTIEPPL